MAIYDGPHDRSTPGSTAANMVLPLLLAAAIVIGLIALLYQSNDLSRLGDANNAGPSVKTVAPLPSPSTSPAVPTPTPITEPRPTQAPIR